MSWNFFTRRISSQATGENLKPKKKQKSLMNSKRYDWYAIFLDHVSKNDIIKLCWDFSSFLIQFFKWIVTEILNKNLLTSWTLNLISFSFQSSLKDFFCLKKKIRFYKHKKNNQVTYFPLLLLAKFFRAELLLILLRNLILPFIEIDRVVTGELVSFIWSKVNSKSSFLSKWTLIDFLT